MNPTDTLQWALSRLAQLQGATIDPLRLAPLLQGLKKVPLHVADLGCICAGLEVDAPLQLALPDRALLPLLCSHPVLGWGLIVDCTPQGRWVVLVNGATHLLDASALQGAIARIEFAPARASVAADGFRQALRKTLRLYRGVLAEAAVASAFIGLLTLGISLFSMQVYDRVIPARSEHTLIILGMGVALAIMLELAMKFARSAIMDSVVVGVDARLSREIFQRLLGIKIDQLPGSVGSLAAQIRGYEQVRSFYTANTLFTLVDLPMGLVVVLVIALIGGPIVAVVPLLCGVVALAIGVVGRRRTNRLAREGIQVSDQKTGLLVEAVEGAETIKAGSGGWKFLSRWININTYAIRNDLRMRSASDAMGYVAAALQQLSYAGLVVVGAWAVMQGGMTMGALIACSILSGRIMSPILMLPGLLVQKAHADAAMQALEQLYALKTDHHGIERPLMPSRIRGQFLVDQAGFAYPLSPPAIRVERLEITPGERIGVLGPIGAGKSTLLRLLAGLYTPQHGRILVDGLDLAHISRQVISQHMGYSQQDHRLFQGTLRENLLIGMPDPGDDAIHQAMHRSGLARLVASHPKGLELPILEGGKGLSGGQRQLVAFTRLLLCNPSIYLLDEPTASMDEAQERHCLAVLAEELLQGSKTLVLVTHKPSMLSLVNRLVVIAGSQIVLDGPRDAVLAQLNKHVALPVAPAHPAAETPAQAHEHAA